MADVCKAGAADLTISSFETCIPKLSLADEARPAAFKQLSIPTFDDTLNASTMTFRRLLLQQGLGGIEAAFGKREPFVIGARIPSELFRKNVVGTDPNVLVLDGLQDARVCIDGHCPYVVSKYDQSLLVFPLVKSSEIAGFYQDVLIFGKDTVFAYGPVLEDGIFVTSLDHLYTAKKLFPLLSYGRSLGLAMLFIGLFLMALGFAMLWSEFLDYGTFCYLTATFAVYTYGSEASLSGGVGLGIFNWYTLAAELTLNLSVAMLVFALATNRTSGRKIAAVLFGSLVFGTLAIVAILPRTTPPEALHWLSKIDFVLSLFTLVVPPGITALGGVRCFRNFRKAQVSGPLSLRLDFRRRTVEQALYTVFLLAVNSQLFLRVVTYTTDRADALRFAPVTGFFLFGIFAVILYHSTTKLAKTHFRSDGMSEAIRLKGRLSTRRYRAWLADSRQGIMMQVDLKNSSLASSSLKGRIHSLMQMLNEAMRASHSRLGYHWVLAKKNGDEWIVILSAKSPEIQRDLSEIVEATRSEAESWERLVKGVAPECSLHINVFALTSYTLGGGKLQARDRMSTPVAELKGDNSWEAIDFASREANYLMKWAGKSSKSRTLTVGASDAVISDGLRSQSVGSVRISELIAKSGSATAESVLDADSMMLTLTCLPWTEAELPVEEQLDQAA